VSAAKHWGKAREAEWQGGGVDPGGGKNFLGALSWRPRPRPNYLLFPTVFSIPFWIHLGSILPSNLAPKIHQNPRKIDAKMSSHLDLIYISIFHGFLLPTWTLQTSIGASGLAPNGFSRIFREPDVGSHFGANLAPFSFPKSIKILTKTNPKRHQFFGGFLDGFFY